MGINTEKEDKEGEDEDSDTVFANPWAEPTEENRRKEKFYILKIED